MLDGLDLLGHVALVSGLVRRLDVDEDEVEVLEGGERGARLGGVVGVEVAGGAGHVEHLHAGAAADAAHEVDGGDDGAAQSALLGEASGTRGAVPWPQSQISVPGRSAASSS